MAVFTHPVENWIYSHLCHKCFLATVWSSFPECSLTFLSYWTNETSPSTLYHTCLSWFRPKTRTLSYINVLWCSEYCVLLTTPWSPCGLCMEITDYSTLYCTSTVISLWISVKDSWRIQSHLKTPVKITCTVILLLSYLFHVDANAKITFTISLCQ